ncbi:MAG: NAD(P)-binding domain-containing protein [Myxococcales bacterium]|nr:MAG: NAD(P)-binding domain-containing protein [Myxococcales bacterium]
MIGELGGMGLIRNAISQGSQAADHILKGNRRASKPGVYDAIVVGAGPAGISATLKLIEGGANVVLLEKEAYGGTIAHYPRAKVVMAGVLDIPMFGKVKRRKMSKEQLLSLWDDIRQRTNLPVQTGELVEGLERRSDGTWLVKSSTQAWPAANVLLALGRRGSPRKLGVAGEEQHKVHYRLLEPKEFKQKHVLIVGGGNSAVESAISLADEGKCKSVTISYRRSTFGRCRAENKKLITEAIAKGKVVALMPSNVTKIDETTVTLDCGDKGNIRIENDAMIIQIGGTAPASLLSTFGIDLITKYGEA